MMLVRLCTGVIVSMGVREESWSVAGAVSVRASVVAAYKCKGVELLRCYFGRLWGSEEGGYLYILARQREISCAADFGVFSTSSLYTRQM